MPTPRGCAPEVRLRSTDIAKGDAATARSHCCNDARGIGDLLLLRPLVGLEEKWTAGPALAPVVRAAFWWRPAAVTP